ncbi:hypothetical protein AAJ76_2000171683 [Vairimorpha ceranae]|uniref:Uncharacterized protein n=1 Tax=Vairimorpha ceranae TaxID=40302 RepID=A0A0F9YW12_9MICR|nr:hypothetical protein AAJ76_2000171683 [Vairimorpha ceranae]KAF5141828.1 hypothetical protein G9O61_00g001110 [Vairimorpha ceranae]KKO76602.1 hypothetical protein AAJ76_2000171683 [Vairimorpha ceranae]
MFDKLPEEYKKIITDKINSYDLQNEADDDEILNQLINTDEYKKFMELEDFESDDNKYEKKSIVVDSLIKCRKYNK